MSLLDVLLGGVIGWLLASHKSGARSNPALYPPHDYTTPRNYYVVLGDSRDEYRIASGWDSKEDADERWSEFPAVGERVRVVTRKTLERYGIDPTDPDNWALGSDRYWEAPRY